MQRILAGLFLILVLVLGACGRSEQPAGEEPAGQTAQESAAEGETAGDTAAGELVEGELPAVNPLEVSGNIVVAGSSTVFPLTEAMAERFTDEGYSGNITVDSIGTGAGFDRFCVAAETDIANASRPIRDEEVASCEENGRTPVEFRVGTDALAVVVNPENDFIEDLTIEQIAQIFSNEVTNWAEVNPEWPEEPIQRFSPGTDSGTFDFFVEAVMEEVYGEEGEAMLLDAGNLQLSEDDNVLVQGVEGGVYSIGYFGYAFYSENANRLQIVNVESVEPSAQSVDSGDYPLARPLFIYSDAGVMQGKPQVASFINFYLTFVNEEVLDVGYFPAGDAAFEQARQNWLTATGME